MRLSGQILLLALLILSRTVPTLAQEAWRNGRNTINTISSNQEVSLGKIFMTCLAKHLHAADQNNIEQRYVCSFYGVATQKNPDIDTLGSAALVAGVETFGKTPPVERVVNKIAGYFRAEYTKYRSDKSGKLYVFGKKPTKSAAKDYYCSLIFNPTSSLSVELKGSFRHSNLRAKFAKDKLAIGFMSEKINDFVKQTLHLKNPTVYFNGNYDLDGSCLAGFSIFF